MRSLAAWCYAHRRRVLVLWIIALVGISVASQRLSAGYATDFSLHGSEAQHAFDLLRSKFPARSGDDSTIVFKATDVRSAAVRARMETVFAEIKGVPHVSDVVSPYADPSGRTVSADRQVAYGTVLYDVKGVDVPKPSVKALIAIAKKASTGGVEVELGGPIIQNGEQEPPGGAEAVGGLAAILILLVTFGSLLAMGLPILTAIFGIGIGMAVVMLLTNVFQIPTFAPQMAAMIGIGVGIDYALFIVTRYRTSLAAGLDPREATIHAVDTSGRAVLFAGTTVVISLLGLLLMGFAFVSGMAIGAASAVLVTMIASITLLPALLGFVGHTIDRLRVPLFHRGAGADPRKAFWFRWSRQIQRRPAVFALLGLLVLVTLSVPVFSLRLGSADSGNDPTTFTTRRAYDLLAEGFGPGFNGPVLIGAQVPRDDAGRAAIDALATELRNTPGIATVSPPIYNPAGDTAVITAFPTTKPQDVRTDRLVHHLRRDVVPRVLRGSGVVAHVGGLTAFFTDFSNRIGQRLPWLIAVVLTLSFLLLMTVFRSVLVPLKAALVNLLSIGAAYGVVVAIFQWGWLKDLVGVSQTGPIESWAPMMLFAILFGLSMDYEVFLLSRVREEYDRTHDNGLAVADGLAATARVITAAAAIMVTVFLSFVLGQSVRQIKLFGIGLAVAILVDATLVRMVLVPATMELLGDANWWLPKWLDRLLPRIHAEGRPVEVVPAESPVPTSPG